MRYRLLVAMAVALAFAGVSCTKAPEKVVDKKQVIVLVNDEAITQIMVQRSLKAISSQHGSGDKPSPNLKEAVLENLISEMLMLQGAREAQMLMGDAELADKLAFVRKQIGPEAFAQRLSDMDATEDEYAQEIRKKVMRQRFVDSLVDTNAVSEDMARRVFDESTTPYLKPAQAEVRFIQADTFEQANKIKQKASREGFDKVAETLTAGEGIVASGYGWTSVSMYGPEISKGLRGLGKGETGGPYKGRQGYFLFRVKDKKPESPMSFDEVKDKIMNDLMTNERNKALAHWLSGRRSSAKLQWK